MAQPKGTSPRPTINTVADRAGVSKSLVSLVLRDSPSVSPEKRAAVQRAMAELGYRPSATARRLRERRSRAVGVFVPDLRQPWFIGMVEGLAIVLAGHGLHVLLADARIDHQTGGSLARTFRELGVDGLVLAGSQPLSALVAELASEVPTVATGSLDVHLPRVDSVNNDDLAGGLLATRHLLELGHRSIAHVAGTLPDSPYTVAALRRAGYEQAMREAGLEAEISVVTADITEEGGYRAAVRLLAGPSRPTGIVCATDLIALGVQGAARELGIGVPSALSIVGYDNSYLAGLRSIWLTSIDGVAEAVGRQAASVLVARIANPGRATENVLLAPSLHRRGTTAHPPA